MQHLTAGVPADPGDSVAMLPHNACNTAGDALLARQVRKDHRRASLNFACRTHLTGLPSTAPRTMRVVGMLSRLINSFTLCRMVISILVCDVMAAD